MKIIRRRHYWICPRCQSALDPEETCDCCNAEARNKNETERKNGNEKNQSCKNRTRQASGSY